MLSNKVNANIQSHGKHHIRTLRENQVSQKNEISIFNSSLLRTIGAIPDTLTDDLIVVQVYYFDMIKDLIYHGFTYKGEKYIYFTSSAGQIRVKKSLFIKESTWNKYEKTIMCGLTLDTINAKGGNNPNKYLAYLALSNSATDEWTSFDIQKSIVIDDFETDVYGTYDFIDDGDYSITRKTGYIPIPHTDGAGMILPKAFGEVQCNKMVRLPFVKGLLGVFDYVKFIKLNKCSPVIKDIYGVEHDVIKENIQVIFTKSQFKLNKFYNNWNEYKEYYKKYHCTAAYTNPEEERIRNATINYQMLQSLTDITDDEIEKIISPSVNRLKNICSSVETMQEAFGATAYNTYKTPLQEALLLYPELLNDIYIKSKLRMIKDSMVKKYRAGKLNVRGKYTFILPDFYAACEYWFRHEANPKGLLEDGEVFCWLFRNDNKLDCLRSPHLYKEHAVRNNVACKSYADRQQELRDWYCTNALYTSSHDFISKLLMFDVDGDKSLVIADETIISVAERNMKDIVPLYYNMKKAEPVLLNNESIYNGLQSAFTGSNIGQYSNSISKIWNNDVFISGTDEEKQEALNAIKFLCCENNYRIDYAKTLYMPERPSHIKDLITHYTKSRVPHFFVYAKDKAEEQVEPVNQSFVNKLKALIPNPRLGFKYQKQDDGKVMATSNRKKAVKLSPPNPEFLMSNPDIEISQDVVNRYNELSRQFYFQSNTSICDKLSGEILCKSQIKQDLIYFQNMKKIKESFSEIGYSDSEITDMLVKYLYVERNSKCKDLLWVCYGEYILKNLKNKIKPSLRDFQCIDCGEWVQISRSNTVTYRCEDCLKTHKRELKRLKMQRYRERKSRVAPSA